MLCMFMFKSTTVITMYNTMFSQNFRQYSTISHLNILSSDRSICPLSLSFSFPDCLLLPSLWNTLIGCSFILLLLLVTEPVFMFHYNSSSINSDYVTIEALLYIIEGSNIYIYILHCITNEKHYLVYSTKS